MAGRFEVLTHDVLGLIQVSPVNLYQPRDFFFHYLAAQLHTPLQPLRTRQTTFTDARKHTYLCYLYVSNHVLWVLWVIECG